MATEEVRRLRHQMAGKVASTRGISCGWRGNCSSCVPGSSAPRETRRPVSLLCWHRPSARWKLPARWASRLGRIGAGHRKHIRLPGATEEPDGGGGDPERRGEGPRRRPPGDHRGQGAPARGEGGDPCRPPGLAAHEGDKKRKRAGEQRLDGVPADEIGVEGHPKPDDPGSRDSHPASRTAPVSSVSEWVGERSYSKNGSAGKRRSGNAAARRTVGARRPAHAGSPDVRDHGRLAALAMAMTFSISLNPPMAQRSGWRISTPAG